MDGSDTNLATVAKASPFGGYLTVPSVYCLGYRILFLSLAHTPSCDSVSELGGELEVSPVLVLARLEGAMVDELLLSTRSFKDEEVGTEGCNGLDMTEVGRRCYPDEILYDEHYLERQKDRLFRQKQHHGLYKLVQ